MNKPGIFAIALIIIAIIVKLYRDSREKSIKVAKDELQRLEMEQEAKDELQRLEMEQEVKELPTLSPKDVAKKEAVAKLEIQRVKEQALIAQKAEEKRLLMASLPDYSQRRPNPQEYKWTEWSPWSECSVNCGGGRQTRSRECLKGFCQGSSFDFKACNGQGVNCPGATLAVYSDWSDWSTCSPKDKLQKRTRECLGDTCINELKYETRVCTPLPGEWEEWVTDPNCDNDCKTIQTRVCIGDTECTGDSQRVIKCFNDVCKLPKLASKFPNTLCYYDFSSQDYHGRDVSGNEMHAPTVNTLYKRTIYARDNVLKMGMGASIILDVYKSIFKKEQELSISMWFNYTARLGSLFSLGGVLDINLKSSGLFINNTRISQEIRENKWHHMIATLSSYKVKIFLDNIEIDTVPILSTMSVLTNITVGDNFQGYIADVLIMNKSATRDTINSLFNDDYGYDVYPLMGQSNMVGRGNMGVADSDYSSIDGRVFQFPYDENNTGTSTNPSITRTIIKDARHQLDFISNTSGGSSGEKDGTNSLWKTFCEKVVLKTPIRRKILLVPVAKGGTSFEKNEWTRSGYIYQGAIQAVNKAMSTNSLNKLSAILWHQGESDLFVDGNWKMSNTTKHKTTLETFYNNLKTDIPTFDDSVPILLGGIGEAMYGSDMGTSSPNQKQQMNIQIKAFCDSKDNAIYVSSEKLQIYDKWHFRGSYLRYFGSRYAYAYLGYLGIKN